MEEVLAVNDLDKSFGAKKVVDSISFSVRKGEIMGLLGPNGAGKTTAIRIIMGIIRADRGGVQFRFNGRETAMDKKRIGYLPEERGLYDDARVLDTLVYLASLKGMDRARARVDAMDWLERLDLKDYASQKLEKLSKGMQQKVQFVAAVLHRPDLIMLDEPFSGLDPINQDLFKDIVRQLQDQGCSILLSAHQMNVVEELCDSIFLIHQGRRILYGDLQEIKDSSGEHIVEIRHDPDEDATSLERIPGVRVARSEPGYSRLHYAGAGDVSGLLRDLPATPRVREITVRRPPLHDIFIQKVRERGEEVEGV